MLRPITFTVATSTNLELVFNKDLGSISTENFVIKSVDGNVLDLKITSISVDGSKVLLKTRPQVAGNYYFLQMLDTDDHPFLSKGGKRLVSDDVSRQVYFVGINNRNPVRDSIYQKASDVYSLKNTIVSDVIDSISGEIYNAQKGLGQVLSDNYISEKVEDELRVRASGATDRLSNENAYKIDRISKNPSFNLAKFEKIEYSEDTSDIFGKTFPGMPVSLHQAFIEKEEITAFSEESSFKNFVITVSNKNVIALKELIVIRPDDIADCNGDIGTKYSINLHKYSIKDNRYDPVFAFKNNRLESNQIMISELGNIGKLNPNDKVVISYLHKDLSKNVDASTVSIYNIKLSEKESIPSSITRFFLKNAPIVNDKNEIPELGGIEFFSENNSSENCFKRELIFNSSKMPSKVGEYTVNYETGEVITVGASNIGEGTGRSLYSASYLYRNTFSENLDYYIFENEVVANEDRDLVGSEVSLSFSYEQVFVEGEDYSAPCHIEVIDEEINSNLSSSFSIRTKNTPVTNVFKILNQTTGEIYNPLYFSDTEVFFSGRRSPEVKESFENAVFSMSENEDLIQRNSFVIPAFELVIKTSLNNSYIEFSPGIPEDLIDTGSTTYYIRSTGLSGEDSISDIEIKFFGEPDKDGLINSLGILETAQPPVAGETVVVGPYAAAFYLQNPFVCSNSGDFIGSIFNSSANFSKRDIFSKEKFYNPGKTSPSIERISDNSYVSKIEYDDNFYKNLSKLRVFGDFIIDYQFGQIYLALESSDVVDFGTISYLYNKSLTSNKNIIAVTEVSRKNSSYDDISEAIRIYDRIEFDNNSISILDLESDLSLGSEESALDLENNLQDTNILLDNYTVVLKNNIKSINYLVSLDDLFEISENDILNNKYNLYNTSYNSFQKNVIDLKRYFSTRVLEDHGTYTIKIDDSSASSIHSIIHDPTGQIIFDEKLNVLKIPNLNAVNSGFDGDKAFIDVLSGANLTDILAYEDFILDQDGSRFLITDVDNFTSRIYLKSPAVNASDKNLPELGLVSVIKKASLSYVDSGIIIEIPSDTFIENYDSVTISYISEDMPDVGSEIAASYNYGDLNISYKYVYDDVYISYEYGDNQIDWSISNALLEGEEYYVSYRFGALREALRDNFGILTKIPYFQDFSLYTDREEYRSALKAVIESFSSGPTIGSFENIVEAFTEITPEITETAMDSWILGRNYLEPEKISVEGPIEFVGSRHKEGLVAQDGTIIKTPAISNINLTEGTISSWVTPTWGGIENDAELSVYLENFEDKRYIYNLGEDVFSFKNNFSIFAKKDDFNIVDNTGLSITLNNSQVFNDEGDEKLSFTPFFIGKKEELFRRDLGYKQNFSIKLNEFNIKYLDIIASLNFDKKGIYGEKILDDAISELTIGFSCISDNFKSTLLPISVIPIFDEDGVSPIYFDLSKSDVSKNNFSKYNRLHKTISCSCSIKDTLFELGSFRDELFSSIEVIFETPVNLQSSLKQTRVLSNNSGAFFFIDENDHIFKVNSFIDMTGKALGKTIPDTISGVNLSRFPVNAKYISAMGSEAVNNIEPSGIGSLCFTAVSLLASESDSLDFWGYEKKSFLVDIFDDKLEVEVTKGYEENILEVSLNDFSTKIFYTDLISNIDSFFQNISEDNKLDPGIYFGCPNDDVGISMDIKELRYNAKTRFNLNNIYIGKSGSSPRSNPFNVSKNSSKDIMTSPYFLNSKEGVYIWFDELCGTEDEGFGKWILRSVVSGVRSVPYDVIVFGNKYETLYEDVFQGDPVEGRVLTDGEFSSVIRSHREEFLGDCSDGVVCSSNYRFCGEGSLPEIGWLKINETSSDLINTLIGGSQNDRSSWVEIGDITSEYFSGKYMAESGGADGSARLVTNMPCPDGNFSLKVNFEVLKANLLGTSFEGDVGGSIIPISPIEISNDSISIKLTLGRTSFGKPCLIVFDSEAKEIVDIVPFNWEQENPSLVVKSIDDIITVEDKFSILTRIKSDEFKTPEKDGCSEFLEPTIAIYVVDSEFLTSSNELSKNKISISLIEYESINIEGNSLLENEDVLISTDSKIEFSFNPIERDGYIDGYGDGYVDGYGDGYISSEVDVDEIRFSSDKVRYLFDTGESESKNRISIFKDGKGFLNFRVYDNGFSSSGNPQLYNIAKNIKDFKPGEIHHIAASWKLNTLYEKDQMHLFVDGLEVPNIFRFGGKIKAKINDKFSDIGKEVLQDFKHDLIRYYPRISDGTILAGSSLFYSNSMTFEESMMGRTIFFFDSNIAGTYVGKKYVLGQIIGQGITILDGDTLDPIVFNTSASDIDFSLAPTAGLNKEIDTDLLNSKYSIFVKNCFSEEREIGGIFYEVKNGKISVENNRGVKSPGFRVNLTHGLIEFVQESASCIAEPSVKTSDIEVHIKTFGLLFRGINQVVDVPSSTYVVGKGASDFDRNIGPGYDSSLSGKSIFMSHAVEPVSLKSVKIKKIVKDRFIPEVDISNDGEFFLATFEEDIKSSLLSSESSLITKENKGRALSISVDSDNIVFCKNSEDGYLEDITTIYVYGKTTDGSGFEEFEVRENGSIHGSKIFLSVDRIEGRLKLADPYYEPCVLSLSERDDITVSNNNGEYAEVFDYINGSFQISTYGSDGSFPFELTPGKYSVSYPAFLNVKIPRVGKDLFFGTDMFGKNSFSSTLDDLKIITEMSSDTRPHETFTSGTRSVTRDFLSPNPSCPDEQTLLLTSFDDPVELQARKLRQKEFFNSESNFKFRLEEDDLSSLIPLLNNQDLFESKMIQMGFSYDDARSTFIEAHHAMGGPLFNDARLIRSEDMMVSSRSVNEKFGQSRVFSGNKPIVLDNDKSFFRKNEGTIEFWVSPILGTKNDFTNRYYVDIFSAERKRIKSDSPVKISLPNSASKIISIKLLTKGLVDKKHYSQSEEDGIIFDEIYRSEITGVLKGGTGVRKDFSVGAKVSPDGRTIALRDALPASRCDVLVTYVPSNSSGERISIYKNSQSQIMFSIANETEIVSTGVDVDWKRNSWHKIRCVYRANSSKDFIKIFVDGSAGKTVSYGDSGIKYGSGSFYGEGAGRQEASYISKKITLKDDFRVICIGGSSIDNESALSRMDNIRFSRIARDFTKTTDGESIDLSFSENINTVLPLKEDDATTLIINSKDEAEDISYAHIVDPKRGIFDFDIDVIDEFEKIDSYRKEDLIIELVNKLKPSHTNALVKFKRKICK